MKTALRKPTFAKATARPNVRVHAHKIHGVDGGKAVLAAGLVAGSLLLGTPAFAAAPSLAEQAAERELLIMKQQQQLEYMLEQQALARKAQLASQRQMIQTQVTSVETQIQQKQIEQRAAVVQAQKENDLRRAEVLAAQEAELEEKAAQVRKAAAQIESKLDRAEMLQRAKLVSEKQQLEKEAQAVKDDINAKLDAWLESIANFK